MVGSGLTQSEIELMREDHVAVHLSMRCLIERFTATGTDVDGHPTGDWSTLYNNLECWYWERERSQYVIQEVKGPVNVVEEFPRIILPADLDLTPDDRIASVTHLDQVIATNLDIRTVLHRLYDTVATIEAQT